MQASTVEILQRLSKGKAGLPVETLLELRRDLANSSEEDVRNAVAKKPKAVKKATAPKPQWLADIEAEKKKVKWSASEASSALIQVAVDEGIIDDDFFKVGVTLPAFATVAKKIAGTKEGERLSRVFQWKVKQIIRDNTLG